MSRRSSFWRLLLVDWGPRAVSQLLWSDKDHEKVYRSPGMLSAQRWPRTMMCDFLRGKSHAVGKFQQDPGNPDSVYTRCETALAVRARNAPIEARRSCCTSSLYRGIPHLRKPGRRAVLTKTRTPFSRASAAGSLNLVSHVANEVKKVRVSWGAGSIAGPTLSQRLRALLGDAIWRPGHLIYSSYRRDGRTGRP